MIFRVRDNASEANKIAVKYAPPHERNKICLYSRQWTSRHRQRETFYDNVLTSNCKKRLYLFYRILLELSLNVANIECLNIKKDSTMKHVVSYEI